MWPGVKTDWWLVFHDEPGSHSEGLGVRPSGTPMTAAWEDISGQTTAQGGYIR